MKCAAASLHFSNHDLVLAPSITTHAQGRWATSYNAPSLAKHMPKHQANELLYPSKKNPTSRMQSTNPAFQDSIIQQDDIGAKGISQRLHNDTANHGDDADSTITHQIHADSENE